VKPKCHDSARIKYNQSSLITCYWLAYYQLSRFLVLLNILRFFRLLLRIGQNGCTADVTDRCVQTWRVALIRDVTVPRVGSGA